MNDPKDAHIDVVLDSEHPTLKFHLESQDIPIGPKSHLNFSNCDHPGFNVIFHLKDPHGLGYLFPPKSDGDNALWSVRGSGVCPSSAAWEIFTDLKVSPDRKTLKAKNVNAVVTEFGFTLNVTKTGGTPYEALDPGGTNHNGSAQMNKVSPLATGLAGLAAGAALTLGAQALLK